MLKKEVINMAIDRRKKPSKPHERQQGSAATATATKTGVTTFPKITPPKDTTTYYGGGGSQAVKQYVPTAERTVPSTTPKTTTPTPTGTSSASNLSPLPTIFDITKSHITGEPWPTIPTYSFSGISGSSSSRSSKSSRSSTSSSDSSAAPTVTEPKPFTPTYNTQPTGGPPPEEWPADAGTGTGVTWQSPQFINDWSASYKSELANLRDEELALAARLNDQFMRQIDSLIGEYTRYYEQMGQGVDPATEAALAKLREEMSNDQRMIMEYLNARGIAQSGIAAEEVGRLAGSYTDQKSQMLAQRLTDLQNQFLSSMQNFMGQKIQAMGTHMGNVMGAQERYTTGMQSAMENAMDMTFGEWQRQQDERAAMEREMLPYTQGPTPYQQAQLRQKTLQQTKTPQQTGYEFTDREREALLYEDIRRVVQEAESGGMDGPTHLNNWFNQNARDIIETFGYNKYQQLREQIINQMYPQPQQPSGISYFR